MKRIAIALAALLLTPTSVMAQDASWHSNGEDRIYKPLSGLRTPFEIQCQSSNSSSTPVYLEVPRGEHVSLTPSVLQIDVFDAGQRNIYRDTIRAEDMYFIIPSDKALGFFVYGDAATDGRRFISALERGATMRMTWSGSARGEFNVRLNGIGSYLRSSWCR